MIEILQENSRKIKFYIQQLNSFLHEYTWILDAYVSDFYFKKHWDRLPQSWCLALSELTTEELSFLLDRKPVQLRTVAPLSLLSFKACCDTFSLDRRYGDDTTNKLHTVFTKTRSSVEEEVQGRCQQHTKASPNKFSPLDDSGKLQAFFRKHVKPKKQHEIQNLAQAIYLLSKHIDCNAVIDVGSGLGHLARLLSFGYNLQVTSVEAAGTHAPKATKFDREIDREIKKKIKTTDGKPSAETESLLPCHVTSMICPNMSTDKFLNIITSQQKQQSLYESIDSNQPNLAISNVGQSDSHTCEKQENINKDSDRFNKSLRKAVGKSENSAYCSPSALQGFNEMDAGTGVAEQDSKSSDRLLDLVTSKPEKLGTVEKHIEDKQEVSDDAIELVHAGVDVVSAGDVKLNTDTRNIIVEVLNEQQSKRMKYTEVDSCIESIDDNKVNDHDSSRDQEMLKSCSDGNTEVENSRMAERDKHQSNDTEEMVPSRRRFVLTGLHACGDLTPTFLRFFVNCEAAVGLVSVGCCYMKMSEERSGNEAVGYPMSEYVTNLPNHTLTYACRELACHFADTYSQRLKECPPLLKIHSYRAALEWIANHLCPNFKRTAVQIPTKKTNNLPFDRYVLLGLQKLDIPEDRLTDDLLMTACKMTEHWKDVVAFYTLRLALAPVVETLVLLDRMMFLYEKGYKNALVPVFDPELSPRNFMLLSWKDSTCTS